MDIHTLHKHVIFNRLGNNKRLYILKVVPLNTDVFIVQEQNDTLKSISLQQSCTRITIRIAELKTSHAVALCLNQLLGFKAVVGHQFDFFALQLRKVSAYGLCLMLDQSPAKYCQG